MSTTVRKGLTGVAILGAIMVGAYHWFANREDRGAGLDLSMVQNGASGEILQDLLTQLQEEHGELQSPRIMHAVHELSPRVQESIEDIRHLFKNLRSNEYGLRLVGDFNADGVEDLALFGLYSDPDVPMTLDGWGSERPFSDPSMNEMRSCFWAIYSKHHVGYRLDKVFVFPGKRFATARFRRGDTEITVDFCLGCGPTAGIYWDGKEYQIRYYERWTE